MIKRCEKQNIQMMYSKYEHYQRFGLCDHLQSRTIVV